MGQLQSSFPTAQIYWAASAMNSGYRNFSLFYLSQPSSTASRASLWFVSLLYINFTCLSSLSLSSPALKLPIIHSKQMFCRKATYCTWNNYPECLCPFKSHCFSFKAENKHVNLGNYLSSMSSCFNWSNTGSV